MRIVRVEWACEGEADAEADVCTVRKVRKVRCDKGVKRVPTRKSPEVAIRYGPVVRERLKHEGGSCHSQGAGAKEGPLGAAAPTPPAWDGCLTAA